jgi:SAM-dependent methyltransferase
VGDERSAAAAAGLAPRDLHERWEGTFLTEPAQQRFFDRCFAELRGRLDAPTGAEIVDAGCGLGHHAIRLARNGWKVRGFDFSRAAVEQARLNARHAGVEVEFRRDDLLHLSLPTSSAEYVICWGVLMHVPDIAQAVSELARVLEPGGKLVVSELNMRSPESIARRRGRFERTASGSERWQEVDGQPLLVRHTDPRWLGYEFARHGLVLRERVVGQISEAYCRPIHWLNDRLLWSKIAPIALSNVFFFAAPRV